MFSTFVAVTFSLLLTWAPIFTSGDKVVRSIDDDLTYDANNRLANHVLAYENSPACRNAGADKVGHNYITTVTVEGEALNKIFPGEDDGSCRAACLDRGVERSLAGNVMPEMYYNNSLDFEEWFRKTCLFTELCLINFHNKKPLTLYWVDKGGNKQRHSEIVYNKYNCLGTYLGHNFEIEDSSTKEIVRKLTMEFRTVKEIGTSPPSGVAGNQNLDERIKQTLQREWDKTNRVTRTFSPLGFKKGRLPPDVFASMGAFYYNNRMNKVREQWYDKGVYVNWWDADVFMIQAPHELRNIWQGRLLSLVEEWAGVPVEQTVMYGMRQYESGARLLTHTDRIETHAVSLIVNVAQGNLTETWPVEVHDHMGRLHEVTMEPGDIVYYESAKAFHGRCRPMMGDGAYYVNIFTHYRPVGDPQWYEKPNPDGTPEPVMEVDGECKLVNMGTTAVGSHHQVGLVQGVQCDDERLGPYVSPSLFTTRSVDDLLEWWQMTSPKRKSDKPAEKTPDSAPKDSDRDEL